METLINTNELVADTLWSYSALYHCCHGNSDNLNLDRGSGSSQFSKQSVILARLKKPADIGPTPAC